MSGIGFSEFLILCVIGLIVLGPKRLPKVANQLGSWVGQARRMTRVMKRQLEEELDFDKELNVQPTIHPTTLPDDHAPPHDDDTYSPLHDQPPAAQRVAGVEIDELADHDSDDADDNHSRDEFDVEPDFDDLEHGRAGQENKPGKDASPEDTDKDTQGEQRRDA